MYIVHQCNNSCTNHYVCIGKSTFFPEVYKNMKHEFLNCNSLKTYKKCPKKHYIYSFVYFIKYIFILLIYIFVYKFFYINNQQRWAALFFLGVRFR
jgi:hypothetical protein